MDNTKSAARQAVMINSHQRPFALGLLALLLLLSSCEPSGWQLEVFDPAARQTHTLTRRSLSHKLLVINYWAEWCKPCIAEIPELNRLAQNEQAIVLIGVNADHKQGADLEAAVQKVNMAFPVAITKPENVFTLPDIEGLPTTLILDERGILKEQLQGPQTYDSLKTVISRLQSQ